MSSDAWPSLSSTSLLSPTVTPTRASRHKGTTNDVSYPSFTRTLPSGATETYAPGDVVIISASAPTRQKWLQPPEYLLQGKRAKGKGKAAQKSRRAEERDVIGTWRHEDGLAAGEKVAVVVALYEDVVGKKMARLRWFARPGAVWSAEGPEEGEEVEPYELYYTSDSTHLHESRSSTSWMPGSPSKSSLAACRTALCTDTLPISHITSHATVVSPAHFVQSANERTFVVKKVYDAKPWNGADFIGEIDWDEVLKRGAEEGDWDVEAISEEQEVPIRKATPKKGRESKRSRRDADVSHPAAEDDEEDSSDGGESQDEFVLSRSSKRGTKEPSDDSQDSASDDSDAEVILTVRQSSKRKAPSTPPSNRKKAGTPRRVVPRMTQNAILQAEVRSKRRSKFQHRSRLAIDIPRPFSVSPAFANLSPFERAKALLHVSATPESLPRRDEQRDKISNILGEAILGRVGTCLYIHGVPGTGKTATVHSVVRELQQDKDMETFQFVEINGMKIAEPNTSFTILWEALSGKKSAPRQALTSLENYFQSPDPTRKTTVVLVDELDQMITKKQDVIYNFFNWPHIHHSRLIVIAVANTMDLPERELSGKIRSRLGSNRIPFPTYKGQDLQAILEARLDGLEVFAPNALERISKMVANVSGDARRALDISRRTVEKVDQHNKENPDSIRLCSMDDVARTYREMTNYGASFFLRRATFHQKVLLLGLSQCIKRAGVPEVEVDNVLHWHLDFLNQLSITPVPSQAELFALLTDLHGQRLLATESQRGDYFQRVRSLVEDSDLFAALKEDKVLRLHVPRS